MLNCFFANKSKDATAAKRLFWALPYRFTQYVPQYYIAVNDDTGDIIGAIEYSVFGDILTIHRSVTKPKDLNILKMLYTKFNNDALFLGYSGLAFLGEGPEDDVEQILDESGFASKKIMAYLSDITTEDTINSQSRTSKCLPASVCILDFDNALSHLNKKDLKEQFITLGSHFLDEMRLENDLSLCALGENNDLLAGLLVTYRLGEIHVENIFLKNGSDPAILYHLMCKFISLLQIRKAKVFKMLTGSLTQYQSISKLCGQTPAKPTEMWVRIKMFDPVQIPLTDYIGNIVHTKLLILEELIDSLEYRYELTVDDYDNYYLYVFFPDQSDDRRVTFSYQLIQHPDQLDQYALFAYAPVNEIPNDVLTIGDVYTDVNGLYYVADYIHYDAIAREALRDDFVLPVLSQIKNLWKQ